MEFLKLGFLFFISTSAHAGLMVPEVDPYKIIQNDQKKKESSYQPSAKGEKIKAKTNPEPSYITCNSSKEFQAAYENLKKQELLGFSERSIVHIAYEVSKGCGGANERFQKILEILLKSGVDKRKSVEIALHFAQKTSEQTEAFLLVFKGTFLESYMDLDFKSALATSLNLALNVKGNPHYAAQDFREVLDFCLSHKGSGLPYKTCAPYALELTKYSHLYENGGMKKSFQDLSKFFAEQKEIDYSLARSLKLAARVLKKGPKSVESFYEQFQYSVSDKMRLPANAALELSVKVAENSLIEE